MKSSGSREQVLAVPLPSELRRFIASKIHSGQFDSEGEVVAGALEIMRDEERMTHRGLTELRREIAIGLKELDAGLGEPWDADALKTEGRRLLASRRGKKK